MPEAARPPAASMTQQTGPVSFSFSVFIFPRFSTCTSTAVCLFAFLTAGCAASGSASASAPFLLFLGPRLERRDMAVNLHPT